MSLLVLAQVILQAVELDVTCWTGDIDLNLGSLIFNPISDIVSLCFSVCFQVH